MSQPISAPYLALIPLLPLAGALTLGLGGSWLQRRLGKGPVGWFACATVGISFVLSCVAFVELARLPPDQRRLLADAEAAIGLAIVLGIYPTFDTIDVDATDRLRG